MADIELLIKIPEIEYEHLTNKERFCALGKSKQEWLINKILNYVVDGSLLPKGHGRLIDADKLLDSDKIIADSKKCHYIPMIDVYQAPTIIEADESDG